jgi:DNA-binding beta-propeller fold protein YncE
MRAASREGQVTTLAGRGGERDFADGIGTSARFLFPRGITLDATHKNLIVADAGNHCVRRISTQRRVVTTIVGCVGVPGYADGAGSSALFNFPGDVALGGRGDEGVIVVADTVNHCIRRISADGEVTTLAGSAGLEGFADSAHVANSTCPSGRGALFSHPSTLFVEASGAVIVADTYNHCLRRVHWCVVAVC